jgi:hypothetical protein
MLQFGERPQEDGSTLAGYAIEIPRANKERVLVFRGRNGRYALIDDFVAGEEPEISKLQVLNGQLVYSDEEGKQVLVRPLGER